MRTPSSAPGRAPRRFFVEHAALDHAEIVFAPREAHHIARVLRLQPGTRLIAFDGGREVDAEVTRVDGSAVAARRLGPPRPARRPIELTLLQGVARGPKMDLIIRTATEIGIAAMHPVLTARAVAGPGSARVARWQRIAQEAARQSGRGDVPAIHEPVPLDAALEALGPVDLFIVPWEAETRPIGEVIAGRAFATAAIFIGPEGGLTPEEVAAARAAGGLTVSLGPLILRTETAGLVSVAMLLYERLLRRRA
ncbi:MAG: RsmE family RNA methyltransferase [Armatimonadota bacterium]